MRRYTYLLFLLGLCLAACENEIPYKGQYQDAKMVVHAVATAGEDSLTCYIGRSYFFLDTKPRNPEVLDSLTIRLEGVSGEYIIIRDSVAGREHHLRLSRPIAPGDTLRLQVTQPRFGTVKAEEVVLPDYLPQVVATTWEKGTEHNDNKYRIRLRLPDYQQDDKIIGMRCSTYLTTMSIQPILDENQHLVRWDTTIAPAMRYMVFSADEMLIGYNKYNEEWKGFLSQELKFLTDYPSGKEMELTNPINYPYDTWHGSEPYRYYQSYTVDSCIMTFKLTSDTYDLYYTSTASYLGVDQPRGEEFDLGMMLADMFGQEEQTPVYSNMVNGFGIFASKTSTKIKIK